MRRLKDDESGAMVVFVGVLMTLLLVLVALVADTGRLYDEHRQLQNGADAAALAIAFDCARDDGTCAASAAALAGQYANANAVDDLSAIDPTSPLVSNPLIDFAERTVTVDTRSQEPGQAPEAGELGFVIEWPDGRESAPVRARAVAKWGVLGATDEVVPLIISLCDFETAVGSPASFPSGPIVITFHDPKAGGATCDAHPGHDTADGTDKLPAGFGALATVGKNPPDDCRARTIATGTAGDELWAVKDPGNDFKDTLECLLPKDAKAPRVVLIPVFLDYCTGKKTCPPAISNSDDAYFIGGYAMFEVSGWTHNKKGSHTAPSCDSGTTCVAGRFLRDVVPTGAIGSGPDFGVRTARLVK